MKTKQDEQDEQDKREQEKAITRLMAETFNFTLVSKKGSDVISFARCNRCGKRLMSHALGYLNERMINHSHGHYDIGLSRMDESE